LQNLLGEGVEFLLSPVMTTFEKGPEEEGKERRRRTTTTISEALALLQWVVVLE
jgi:hypothetical protein